MKLILIAIIALLGLATIGCEKEIHEAHAPASLVPAQ
jgi:hypothetical protein